MYNGSIISQIIMEKPVQLGKDIVSLSDFQIDPNSSHRPPPAKKTKQCNKRNTKKNNEQSSSQKPFTSSQDARTFTQQPSTATPTPVIQLQTQLMCQIMISLNSIRFLRDAQFTRRNHFVYKLVVLIISCPRMTCSRSAQ